MKDAIIEAMIIAAAIFFGLLNIADALRDVHVEMKTTVRLADEADDGPR